MEAGGARGRGGRGLGPLAVLLLAFCLTYTPPILAHNTGTYAGLEWTSIKGVFERRPPQDRHYHAQGDAMSVRWPELGTRIASGGAEHDMHRDLEAASTRGYSFSVSTSSELNTALSTAASVGATCTIYLAAYAIDQPDGGYYMLSTSYSFTNSSSDVTLASVDGSAALRAAADSRHFTIYTAKLTAQNVTFSGGTDYDRGGSIFAYGSGTAVTLKNCTFSENTLTYRPASFSDIGYDYGGGAVACSSQATCVLEDVVFDGNTAYTWGGALKLQACTATLTSVTFRNNSAEYGGAVGCYSCSISELYSVYESNTANFNGGAVAYVGGISSSQSTQHSTFAGNTAMATGGAIYANISTGVLSFSSCTFEGNYADLAGGAICAFATDSSCDSCYLSLESVTMVDNVAMSVGGAIAAFAMVPYITSSTLTNNSAPAAGGAVYLYEVSLTASITSTVFLSNNATNSDSQGGGIAAFSGSYVGMTDTNFTDNNAAFGGGLCVSGDSNVTCYQGVTFSSNRGTYGGGVAVLESATYTSVESVYVGNEAEEGGGVFVLNSTATLDLDTWTRNKATRGSDVYQSASTVSCSSSSDSVSVYGGYCSYSYSPTPSPTYYTYPTPTSTSTTSWTCSGGTITTSAGLNTALSAYDSSCTSYITFAGNRTTYYLDQEYTLSYGTLTLDGSGVTGGVTIVAASDNRHFYLSYVTFTASYITFADGYSATAGGSIYISNGYSYDFQHVDFTNNTVGYQSSSGTYISDSSIGGGALFLRFCEVTMLYTSFSNNSASGSWGGAIKAAMGGYLYCSGCTFHSNTARFGGGVHLEYTSAYCTDSSFAYNEASVDGGAILLGRLYATLTLNGGDHHHNIAGGRGGVLYVEAVFQPGYTYNAVLRNNQATYGAGIYIGPEYWADGSVNTQTLSSVTVKDNTATRAGGAIYARYHLELENCYVTNNAAEEGGGVYLNSTSASLESSYLKDNYASVKGGGLYGSGSTLEFYSTSIEHNNAPRGAGVALLSSSAMSGTSTTYTDNNATEAGGGLYLVESNVTTYYDSFSSNHAPSGGAVYVNDSASYITLTSASFSGNTAQDVYALKSSHVSCTSCSNATITGGGTIDTSTSTSTSTITRNAATPACSYTVSSSTELNSALSTITTAMSTTCSMHHVGFNGTQTEYILMSTYTSTRPITLNASSFGDRVTLWAAAGHRHFSFSSATFKALNVKFMNGTCVDGGGSILATTSPIYLYDCVFTKNTQTSAYEGSNRYYGGAAILTYGGVLQLSNTSFHDNTAAADGGAVKTTSTYVTVIGGTWENNRAGAHGGALYAQGSSLTVNESASFTSNYANSSGGAVYVNAAASNTYFSVTLKYTSFASNEAANGGGGAIGVGGNGSALNVQYCTFTNNKATDGGAIDATGAYTWTNTTSTGTYSTVWLRVYRSNFTGDTATSGSGGAIRSVSYADVGYCTITGARAAKWGGAIKHSDAVGTFYYMTIKGCKAGYYGGAVYLMSTDTTSVYRTTMYNNTAFTGGGLFLYNSKVTVSSTTYHSNSASSAGGAAAVTGVSTFNSSNDGYTLNSAGEYGGAVYYSSAALTSRISHAAFYSNTAGLAGADLYSMGSAVNQSIVCSSDTSVSSAGGATCSVELEVSVSSIMAYTYTASRSVTANQAVQFWFYAVEYPNTTVPYPYEFKAKGVMGTLYSSGTATVVMTGLFPSTTYYGYGYLETDTWVMPYSYISGYTLENFTTLAVVSSPASVPSPAPTPYPPVPTPVPVIPTPLPSVALPTPVPVIPTPLPSVALPTPVPVTPTPLPSVALPTPVPVIPTPLPSVALPTPVPVIPTPLPSVALPTSAPTPLLNYLPTPTPTPPSRSPLTPTPTPLTGVCTFSVKTSAELDAAFNQITYGSCNTSAAITLAATAFTLSSAYTVDSVITLKLDGSGQASNVAITATAGSRHLTLTNTTLYATNVEFTGGTAYTSGGSILLSSGEAYVDSCSFTYNTQTYATTADSYGGGAVMVMGGATLSLIDTWFSHNSASAAGGAVQIHAGYLTATGGGFKNNSAPYGGAIYLLTAYSHYLTNVTVSANKASSGAGGGLYITQYAYAGAYTDVLFSSNVAATYGGAVYIHSIAADHTFTSSYFTTNKAQYSGGAMYVGSYSGYHYVKLEGSEFMSNHALLDKGGDVYSESPLVVTSCVFKSSRADNLGGCVSLFWASSDFTSTTFKNCTSANSAGGALSILTSAYVVAYDTTFDSNTCPTSIGAAVYLNNGKMSVRSSYFKYNTAATNGGAVFVDSGSSFNTSWDTYTGNTATSGYGGAIYVAAATAQISSATFSNNLAGSGAADAYVSTTLATVTCSLASSNAIVNTYNTLSCAQTSAPSSQPTQGPTMPPTNSPNQAATTAPTIAPSPDPTNAPSFTPTAAPSQSPTNAPSRSPTVAPSTSPTAVPTISPTIGPTMAPTLSPTNAPSMAPTFAPSVLASMSPTNASTAAPTTPPTMAASMSPTNASTAAPTTSPTMAPSISPTTPPSQSPTTAPTMSPTTSPSQAPSIMPTLAPSHAPTIAPSIPPTTAPSIAPTLAPSHAPTIAPSIPPTTSPTYSPTIAPTRRPTMAPSTKSPTTAPTSGPAMYPKVTVLRSNSTSSTASLTVMLSRAGYVWCTAQASTTSPGGAAIKASTTSTTVAVDNGNVTVTASGLTALTQYYMFCYTEDTSKPANVLPDTDVAQTKTSVSTLCCYALSTPTLPTTLYSTSVSSALTVASPITGISVQLSSALYASVSQAACPSMTDAGFRQRKSNATSISVSPGRTLSFATSTSQSFTLYASVGGCYAFRYAVTGHNASKVSPPSNSSIYILTSESIPTAPVLSTAKFTSTGSQLTFRFDSATDGGGMSGTFACSALVWFRGVGGTVCSWSSSAVLLATLGSAAVVVPGNTAMLLGKKIKAECATGATLCSQYTYSSTKNVTVASPDTPLVPSIALTYATTLSSCAAMSFDASSSTGSGGRSMYYNWYVDSVSGANMTLINTYLKFINPTTTNGTTFGVSKLSLPSSYLEPGVYKAQLVVTNFLQSSSSSSAVYVTVKSDAVPSVSIDGGAAQSMYTSSALSLFARASISTCSKAKKLTYHWIESSRAFASSSNDPRYFRLSAYSLTPGKTYNFTIVATDSLSNTNNASVTMTVLKSALIASINGGNRAVGIGNLTLDATYSADPDLQSSQSSGLSYTWSCIRGGSLYGQSCGVSLASIGKPTAMLTSSGSYIFTVTVTKDTRTASTSITVTVQSATPPAVSITPLSTTKVSKSSRTVIVGSITPSYSGSFNATWSLLSGSLAVSSLSAAATTSLTVKTSLSPYRFALVLSANSMVEKTMYTLRLAAQQYGVTGYSTISFTTNGPPTPGSISVSPTTGYALTTYFTFTASSWTDDSTDYPLYYSYYYIVGGDTSGAAEVALATSSLSTSYENARLPQGSGSTGNITAVIYVSDSYGASARAAAPLHVTEPQLSVQDLQNTTDTLLSAALESSDVDVLFQVVGAGAGILNAKSCDDATSCQDLRESYLGYVSEAASLQDTDQDSLAQLASTLDTLTSVPSQLSGAAEALALSLITSVASSSASVGITSTAANSVGSTLSSLLSTDMASSASKATSLSDGINDLSAALWVGVEAGEQPLTVNTDNLKLSSEVSYAADLENKALSPPGGSSGITLPGDGLSGVYAVDASDEISMAVVSMPNLHNGSSSSTSGVNTSSGAVVASEVLRLVLSTSSSTTASRRHRHLLPHHETTFTASEIESKHHATQKQVSGGVGREWKDRRLSDSDTTSSSTSTSSSSYVTIVMSTTSSQNYTSDVEYLQLNCSWDEYSSKQTTCDATGEVFNITCTGRQRSVEFACVQSSAPVCAYWDGIQWVTSCQVYKVTPTNTTCHCYDLSAALTDSSRRRRLTSSSSQATADLALVVGNVASGFLHTLSDTPLSLSSIAKNMVVFVTIGSFLGLAVLLVVYGELQDRKDFRKMVERVEKERQQRFKMNPMLHKRKPHAPTAISPPPRQPPDSPPSTRLPQSYVAPDSPSRTALTTPRPDVDTEEERSPRTPPPYSDAFGFGSGTSSSSSSSSEGEDEMMEHEDEQGAKDTLEKSLPAFAKVTSYWWLLVQEIGRRHSWFSLAVVYSRKVARSVRVAMLTTATLTTMFLSALLYDQSFPDQTPCASHTTKTTCLSEPSPYYAGRSNCKWNSEAQACSFNQPRTDFFTIIIVSVATAIFATPMLMFASKIFEKLLIPPTKGHIDKLRALVLTPGPVADGQGNIQTVPDRSLMSSPRGRHRRHKKHLKLWDPMKQYERKKKRAIKLQAATDAAVAELLDTVQKRRQELVDFVNHLQTKIIRDIQESHATAAGTGLTKFLRTYEKRDDQRKLDQLVAYLRQFEREWHMGSDGSFLRDSWWKRCTRNTFVRRLRKKVKEELQTAEAIERELKRIRNPRTRQVRLVEYARVDFLYPTERKIYLRNKIIIDEDGSRREVDPWAKYLGWALLSLLNMGLGFYVCMFGIQKGASTTNAWLAAFFYSAAQDILISAPLIILWFNVYLPAHIKHRLREEVDSANGEPFKFSHYIPPGPAARVIRMHPNWALRLPGQDETLHADATLSPRTEQAIEEQFVEKYREHFRQTKAVTHTIFFYASFAVVTAFLAMPDVAQDMALNQFVPILVGAVAWGFQQLYKLQQWLVSVPAAAIIVLLCLTTLIAYSIKTTKVISKTRGDAPAAAMLTPLSSPKFIPQLAETGVGVRGRPALVDTGILRPRGAGAQLEGEGGRGVEGAQVIRGKRRRKEGKRRRKQDVGEVRAPEAVDAAHQASSSAAAVVWEYVGWIGGLLTGVVGGAEGGQDTHAQVMPLPTTPVSATADSHRRARAESPVSGGAAGGGGGAQEGRVMDFTLMRFTPRPAGETREGANLAQESEGGDGAGGGDGETR